MTTGGGGGGGKGSGDGGGGGGGEGGGGGGEGGGGEGEGGGGPVGALRRTRGDAAGAAEAVLEQLEQRVLPEGGLTQAAVGHAHAIDGQVGSQGAARAQEVEGRAPARVRVRLRLLRDGGLRGAKAWGEGGELGGCGQRHHRRLPPRPPFGPPRARRGRSPLCPPPSACEASRPGRSGAPGVAVVGGAVGGSGWRSGGRAREVAASELFGHARAPQHRERGGGARPPLAAAVRRGGHVVAACHLRQVLDHLSVRRGAHLGGARAGWCTGPCGTGLSARGAVRPPAAASLRAAELPTLGGQGAAHPRLGQLLCGAL